MQTSDKVEYMAFPRMIALSEVVWSNSDTKNYDNFVERLEFFNERLDVMNVNYANHLYEVSGELINKNGQISYQLETTTNGKSIRFTTDNSKPNSSSNVYTDKIEIKKSLTIKAGYF